MKKRKVTLDSLAKLEELRQTQYQIFFSLTLKPNEIMCRNIIAEIRSAFVKI